jgi:hypothetical protein
VAWYGLMALAGWVAAIGLKRTRFGRRFPLRWGKKGPFLLIFGAVVCLAGVFWAAFPLATIGVSLVGLGLGLWRLESPNPDSGAHS